MERFTIFRDMRHDCKNNHSYKTDWQIQSLSGKGDMLIWKFLEMKRCRVSSWTLTKNQDEYLHYIALDLLYRHRTGNNSICIVVNNSRKVKRNGSSESKQNLFWSNLTNVIYAITGPNIPKEICVYVTLSFHSIPKYFQNLRIVFTNTQEAKCNKVLGLKIVEWMI